jgi:colanic acid/amylovoran biosynthesis glycosyltransferase
VGVDTERFSLQQGEAPPQDPAADEPFRVLSVGRLVAKKGHDLLIQAGRLAASRELPLEIRIAGEGPQEAELRQAAEEAPGSGCQIRFLGPLSGEQVLEELASAHLFALACRCSPEGDMDGIPASLMEAMAMELPVLTTRLSGIPELVEDRRHGRLVEPEDLVGLAKALSELASLPREQRRALGRAGRETVNTEFNCRRSAAMLDREIRQRIARPGTEANDQ